MCSHRLSIAKLVREYKEPLFSPVSSQVSRQNKQELWEHIRQQAVAQGAVQYMRKSWKEIRDSVWAPIRRDTMAKVNKARTVGEDTVVFTEIDRVVLDIIGSNGTGGGAEQDEGGGTDGGGMMSITTNNSGMAPIEDNDNMTLNALVAELAADGVVSGEFKQSPTTSTLSQMIGLDQFAAVLNGGGGAGGHQQQQQMMTMMNGGGKGHEMKAHKRRALELSSSGMSPLFHPPPSSTPFRTSNPTVADFDLDKAIKQAKLEQLKLQNMLIQKQMEQIQEQIEKERLQNQLLRMDLRKRQREEGVDH